MEFWFAPRMKSRNLIGRQEVSKMVFKTSKCNWYALEDETDPQGVKGVHSTGAVARDGVVENPDSKVYHGFAEMFMEFAGFPDTAKDMVVRVFCTDVDKNPEMEFIGDDGGLVEIGLELRRVHGVMKGTLAEMERGRDFDTITDEELFMEIARRLAPMDTGYYMMKSDCRSFRKGKFYKAGNVYDTTVSLWDGKEYIYVPMDAVMKVTV